MKYLLVSMLLLVGALAQDGNTLPVSVDVAADRTATIAVPLDPAFHAFVLQGSVFGPDGRLIDTFQRSDLRGPEYRRVLTLPAGKSGKYSVFVAVRNLDSQGKRAWINFTVN